MSALTGRFPRDANRVPAMGGVSSANGVTTFPIEINPTTGRLLVDVAGILAGVTYDYASLAQTSTIDTWTFKVGGSGGTLVATITITYTDSTKATISTVVRT
jgi:hypothetical protein